MERRSPTQNELSMIKYLISKSNLSISDTELDGLEVESMDDGGMGSLLLFLKENTNYKRVFEDEVAEYIYNDVDNVEVNITLNIDSHGNLFELDIWKVDSSPLVNLPNMDNI